MKEYRGRGDLSWLLTNDTLGAYGVEPRGVLHIGAHEGEEIELYQELKFATIDLVEPDPSEELVRKCRHHKVGLHSVAVANVQYPRQEFFVREANTHQSHLALRTEQLMYANEPQPTVYTVNLGYVQARVRTANVLVVDTAGTELDVLKSGELGTYDLVIVETDDQGVYASAHEEVTAYMGSLGWKAGERWRHGDASYGDVVFHA